MRLRYLSQQHLCLLALVLVVTRVEIASSRRCLFSFKSGMTLNFTSTKQSRGLTLLQSFYASNIKECKTECCADQRCNALAFYHYASDSAINCFTVHCNVVLGCRAVEKADYYLYWTEEAMILSPSSTTSTTTTTTTTTSTTTTTTATPTTTLKTRKTTVATAANAGNSPVLPTNDSASSVLATATAQSWKANELFPNATLVHESMVTTRKSTTTTPASLVAEAQSTTAGDVHAHATEALNATLAGPILWTTKARTTIRQLGDLQSIDSIDQADEGASPFANVTVLPKTYRRDVQYAYRVLVSIAVLGTVLLVATVYIMWRSHREVRHRQYKEIVFLLHDQDVMYA